MAIFRGFYEKNEKNKNKLEKTSFVHNLAIFICYNKRRFI